MCNLDYAQWTYYDVDYVIFPKCYMRRYIISVIVYKTIFANHLAQYWPSSLRNIVSVIPQTALNENEDIRRTRNTLPKLNAFLFTSDFIWLKNHQVPSQILLSWWHVQYVWEISGMQEHCHVSIPTARNVYKVWWLLKESWHVHIVG